MLGLYADAEQRLWDCLNSIMFDNVKYYNKLVYTQC